MDKLNFLSLLYLLRAERDWYQKSQVLVAGAERQACMHSNLDLLYSKTLPEVYWFSCSIC